MSTHAPLARRNLKAYKYVCITGDFYSRTSCEAQLIVDVLNYVIKHFYSRTSCEAQRGFKNKPLDMLEFLLTHLLRGATILLKAYVLN